MSGPRQENTTQAPFPDLHILPLEALLPHEEHDPQRALPLIERLRQDSTWLNPPIIAPIDSSDRYVILDGANRHHALQALGYAFILAQVVPYQSKAVHLETWHHAVRGLPLEALLSRFRAIDGVTVQQTSLLNARAALASRQVLAYSILKDERVFALRQDPTHEGTRTAMLRQVVGAYKHDSQISRITHDEMENIRRLYPDATAIVVFPRYEPAEIMVAARDRDLLPPGITRHIIYGRALHLHYPLQELQHRDRPLEEKNARLQGWVRERLAQKRVRFYADPTFLFDE